MAYMRARAGRERGTSEKPGSFRKVAQSYLIIPLQTGLRVTSSPISQVGPGNWLLFSFLLFCPIWLSLASGFELAGGGWGPAGRRQKQSVEVWA